MDQYSGCGGTHTNTNDVEYALYPPQRTNIVKAEEDDFLDEHEMYDKESVEDYYKWPKPVFKAFDLNNFDEAYKRFHERRKTHCPLANYKGEKDLNDRYEQALRKYQQQIDIPDSLKDKTPKSTVKPAPHVSLSEARTPKSVKTRSLTARYDRRKHCLVTGNVDRYRCQYRNKYVCSERVKTPNTPYCTKHQSLNEEVIKTNTASTKIIINSNQCAFVVKSTSSNKNRYCTDLCTSSNSKYCETHTNEIQEMKTTILNSRRSSDHVEILFHNLQATVKGETAENESSCVVKPVIQMGQQYEIRMEGTDTQPIDGEMLSQQWVTKDVLERLAKVQLKNYKADPLMSAETERYHVCESDSEDEEDYTSDCAPHEILSTAGYFATEEVIRLLRDKLLQLNSIYKLYKNNNNLLFLHRRRILQEELREETKLSRKYCSNPTMLPVNKDFSKEFILNETMARSEVRVSLRKQARAEGHVKLALLKYSQVVHPSKQTRHSSANPDQSKSVGSGVTMSTGGKQCSGGKLKADPNAPHNMANIGRCISTDEQVDDDFDTVEAITPPLPCCAPDCEKLQMPFTTYCLNHITQDTNQKLFVKCGVLKYRNETCDVPVTCEEDEGCRLHCGELPPDLPMDEEEKERIIEAESKQMISVNDEGKAVETLLFCQLADMEHLNKEMDIVLQAGYLSTDSESDQDSTDDERKLPPLNEEAYLNDPDDDLFDSDFDNDEIHEDDIIEEDEDYIQETHEEVDIEIDGDDQEFIDEDEVNSETNDQDLDLDEDDFDEDDDD